jgi:hypothetical protein
VCFEIVYQSMLIKLKILCCVRTQVNFVTWRRRLLGRDLSRSEFVRATIVLSWFTLESVVQIRTRANPSAGSAHGGSGQVKIDVHSRKIIVGRRANSRI